MSHIDDLIKELCPEGVRFESIGSVVQRGSTIRWADVAGKEFQYIDLTSVDRITHAITETQTITSENAPSRAQQLVREGDVIFGTTRPMLKRYTLITAEYDGQIASTGYCVLRPQSDRILSNFLFHLLGTPEFYAFVEENERGASYPAIPDGVVKEFRIPIPPLEVQREVVRALDLFSGLAADLATQLDAELEARQRQYAYYRDDLFTFRDIEGVKRVPIGELGEIFRGKRFTKADYVPEGGVACIHYGEIYTDYGTAATHTVSRVRADLAQSLRFAHKGDVVLTDVGETVEDVGKAVAWLGDEDAAIHDHCYVIRSSVNPVYLSYYMQTAAFRADKDKYIARTKVKTLLLNGLKRVEVPVPSPDEQKRIVSVLDKFKTPIADLSVALPAEINARRKQYEYHRDRLLTFEELAA